MSYYVDVSENLGLKKIFIFSINPASGHVNDFISIRGSNFYGIDKVKFGDTEANFTVTNDKYILASVPENAPYDYVSVESALRSTTGTFLGYKFAPFPSIESISPVTGNQGTLVTVEGTSFSGVTNLYFNGIQSDNFKVISDTQITGLVPSGLTYGYVSVTGQSGVYSFSEQKFYLKPSISGLSPTSGQIGSTLTISGDNFFSEILTDSPSGSQNYVISIGNLESTGHFLRVNNQTLTGFVPQDSTSGSVFLYYNYEILESQQKYNVLYDGPTILDVQPLSGGLGDLFSITGTNFYEINSVTLSGYDNTQVQITGFTNNFETGLGLDFQLWDDLSYSKNSYYAVLISGTFGEDLYHSGLYILGDLTFSGFNPTSGKIRDVIQLSGENLYSSSRVFLGVSGNQCETFSGNNDNLLYIRLPQINTTGLSFYIDNGVSFDTGNYFRGILTPSLNNLSPYSGTKSDILTISGSGLELPTTIKVGTTTISSSNYSLVGNTGISITLPSRATDGKVYFNGLGGSAQTTGTFNFLNPPIVFSGSTPETGYIGASITITGDNLDTTSEIRFTGVASTIVSLFDFALSGTHQLTATVPSNILEGSSQKIMLVDSDNRYYHAPSTLGSFNADATEIPYISGFDPLEGPTGSIVLISGSGINSVTSLYINSIETTFTRGPRNGVTVISGVVPYTQELPQTVDIQVVSPKGSHTRGDYLVYIQEPHIYKNIQLFGEDFNHPDSGVQFYLEKVDQTGIIYLGDPNGNEIILSTFIL